MSSEDRYSANNRENAANPYERQLEPWEKDAHKQAVSKWTNQGRTPQQIEVNLRDLMDHLDQARVLQGAVQHEAILGKEMGRHKEAYAEKFVDTELKNLRRQEPAQTTGSEKERVYTPAERQQHYAPLNRELHADDARQFGWRAETGTVQTYQHEGTRRHIHIDGPSGQFFDQQKNPITQEAALDRAMGTGNHHATQKTQVQETAQQRRVEQGVGFGL